MSETQTITLPVRGLGVKIDNRVWQSDWFTIGVSQSYTFTHNLDLAEPWICSARLVGMVTQAAAGWSIGDVVLGDGANFNGAKADTELGWAINITEDTIHVGFGNGPAFISTQKNGGFGALNKDQVKCKLVINY